MTVELIIGKGNRKEEKGTNKKKDTDATIAYQNKDIVSKLFGENFVLAGILSFTDK